LTVFSLLDTWIANQGKRYGQIHVLSYANAKQEEKLSVYITLYADMPSTVEVATPVYVAGASLKLRVDA
jgi:hypothetical protein